MSLRSHEDRNEETFQSIGLIFRTATLVIMSSLHLKPQSLSFYRKTMKAQCARRELLAMGRTFADPQTGVAKGRTFGRNMRSKCRCSMCPAIHINSRSWLRSSSTHEPSDPPPKVITLVWFFLFYDTGQTGEANPKSAQIDFQQSNGLRFVIN